jgi:hypothetical protein
MRRWRLRGLVPTKIVGDGTHRSAPADLENRSRSPEARFPRLIEVELPTVATTNVDGR